MEKMKQTVSTLESELTENERVLGDVMRGIERTSLLFSLHSVDGDREHTSHFLSSFVMPLMTVGVCLCAASWVYTLMK